MAILDFLSAHLAILCLISALMLIIVSIQMDYRGDVQNVNSQLFSNINAKGPYKCIGRKFDLAIKRANVNLRPSF